MCFVSPAECKCLPRATWIWRGIVLNWILARIGVYRVIEWKPNRIEPIQPSNQIEIHQIAQDMCVCIHHLDRKDNDKLWNLSLIYRRITIQNEHNHTHTHTHTSNCRREQKSNISISDLKRVATKWKQKHTESNHFHTISSGNDNNAHVSPVRYMCHKWINNAFISRAPNKHTQKRDK